MFKMFAQITAKIFLKKKSSKKLHCLFMYTLYHEHSLGGFKAQKHYTYEQVSRVFPVVTFKIPELRLVVSGLLKLKH